MSLSSNKLDDDRKRQEEESTITKQQESTFHLELLQQFYEEVDLEPQNQSCRGVKLVTDTTIHSRQQRSDQQTKSLYYCNTMAVQDWIDIAKFLDGCKKAAQLANFNVLSLLPSEADLESIRYTLL